MANEDIGEGVAPSNPKSAPKSVPSKVPFKDAPDGRSIVLVPDDQNEQRAAVEGLQALLKEHNLIDDKGKPAPGAKIPRILTSLKLAKIDGSFVIYTATAGKNRQGERELRLSKGVECGKHTTEAVTEDIGADIDFGVQLDKVKVLDLPKIVDALQKGVGPNWRVMFRAEHSESGSIRLLNT